MIQYVWASTVGANNGGNVTINIPPSSVASEDVVLAFGGKSGRAAGSVGPPIELGYTSIYTTGAVDTGPNFWAGFKIMDNPPDASFLGLGSGNIADGTGYGLYIFRGVDSVIHDVPFQIATGNSTNPNPPSIVTVTNNAVVFIPAGKQVSDAVFESVLGYSDFKRLTANDTLTFSAAGNWASIAVAGSTDPGAYQLWGSTTSWVALSIALRPQTTVASALTWQVYNSNESLVYSFQ